MASKVVDIHPHVIADDPAKYPLDPLFGVQSGWSKERPVPIAGLIAAMDDAGVDKAAIVQASTCFGFDNSYVADSIAKHPGRLTGVGSIDLLASDNVLKFRAWNARGITGLRMFMGGSTAAFDTSAMDAFAVVLGRVHACPVAPEHSHRCTAVDGGCALAAASARKSATATGTAII